MKNLEDLVLECQVESYLFGVILNLLDFLSLKDYSDKTL
jgi:hypothetical protein